MPILDATTTSVLVTVTGSSTVNYAGNMLGILFSQGLSVGIWLVEAIWPFLLVVGILVLFVSVASKMLHWHR